MCILPMSPCAFHFNRTVLCAVTWVGQAFFRVRIIGLILFSAWNTLPLDTCMVCNQTSSKSLFNVTFLVTPFQKLYPLTYSFSWLHFSSWPFSPSNILCRTSIRSQSIYKVHHCLVALIKVLNFKAQLNSSFHRTASYCMFLKIRQKEGLLSQIKI